MKSLISRGVPLLALIFVSLLSAQAATPPTWAESYGVGSYNFYGKPVGSDPYTGSGRDVPKGIAPMPDGGFVVSAQIAFPYLTRNSYSIGGASDAVLLRFAPDGTILWQFELDQTNDGFNQSTGTYEPAPSYIARIRTDAQGNIFVAGTKSTRNSYRGSAPFVAKFSPAGQLIWQNGIPEAGGTVPGTPPQPYTAGVTGATLEMALTFDGGVVLTGSQGRPNGYTVPVITKFDAKGAVVLYRAYENPDQYLPNGPVAQTADGSKFVTIIGHQLPANPNVPNAPYGLYVFVTDSGGNLLAQRAFPGPDGGREYPLSLIRTADGGLASLSAKDDFTGIIFRKFNADASAVIIERLITPAAGQPAFFVGSLFEAADTGSFTQTSDGGFLIGGHCKTPSGVSNEDAGLMKLRANGTVEFVSLIGGNENEGEYNYYIASGSVAIPLTGGGYGIAITTYSYVTEPAGQKTDLWMVKADANRKVRNFKGTMVDLAAGSFNVTGSPHAAVPVSHLTTPPYSAGPLPSGAPGFVLVDPGSRTGVDHPSFAIQASGPRIISGRKAEAVVGQHFAYHTETAFFDATGKVTYSATGLPQGFVINPATGVISGVAGTGTETTTPIAIVIKATDGVDSAQITLLLTIGDGVPVFTVNGSAQPAPAVADTVLTFATRYPGQRAGRVVAVQWAPSSQGPWTDLDTGLSGFMAYDFKSGNYVLGTTNYPQQNGVWFRSRVVTNGFASSEVDSNVVGPFDLASAKVRTGKTVFRLKRNGLRADFDFRVTELGAAPGIALRVQSTRTPSDESSWTDITDAGGNNVSAMNQDGDSSHYALLKQSLPAGSGLCFRAIAAGGGLTDSPSNFIGPYTIEAATPPSVNISSPASGTAENPFVIKANASGVATIPVHATATAGNNRGIAYFALLLDGEPMFSQQPGGTATATIDYVKNTNSIGDHVIEALAVDDKGQTARAGTGPHYIRIVPADSVAAKAGQSEASAASSSTGRVFHVVKSGGLWDDPTTWQDSNGANGVPGRYDFAVIGNSTVQVVSIEGELHLIGSVSISGGQLLGSSTLDVFGTFTITGGTCDHVNLFVHEGAVLDVIASSQVQLGFITNYGRWKMHGTGGVTATLPYTNRGTIEWQIPLLVSPAAAALLPPNLRSISGPHMQDLGKVSVQSLVTDNGAGIVTNTSANLIGDSGSSLISQDGGSLINQDGASLLSEGGLQIINQDNAGIINQDNAGIISTDGHSLINQDGASLINQDGASLARRNGGVFKVGSNGSAAMSADGATAFSGYVKQGGELDMSGIAIIGPVSLEAGVLNGSGVIVGDLTNHGGYIAPGHSPGVMLVTGNFAQENAGTLILEVAGAEPGQFDQLKVTGGANLGGKLDLKTINGFVPLANDPLNQLTASAASGSFSSVSSNGGVAVNSTGITTTTNPNAPNPPTGQPLNIATRLAIQSGDNALFAGFIVTGPSGSTKKVMIRAIGPSLEKAGVTGTIADPFLELHKPDGSVSVNDNWQQGATTQIPNGFAPGDPRESVIVATLSPGSYSAVVKGAHGETGVGLAEVYDLDSVSKARLANIATRGFVQTGDNVLIGGFIVGGTEPAKMLVRAIGPSLAAFGVPNTLPATMLELHDANGSVITNDGWRSTQESEINATTIPPSNDKEAAILATLVPGSYTAVVRGQNDTTGIAVVEAYNLQ